MKPVHELLNQQLTRRKLVATAGAGAVVHSLRPLEAFSADEIPGKVEQYGREAHDIPPAFADIVSIEDINLQLHADTTAGIVVQGQYASRLMHARQGGMYCAGADQESGKFTKFRKIAEFDNWRELNAFGISGDTVVAVGNVEGYDGLPRPVVAIADGAKKRNVTVKSDGGFDSDSGVFYKVAPVPSTDLFVGLYVDTTYGDTANPIKPTGFDFRTISMDGTHRVASQYLEAAHEPEVVIPEIDGSVAFIGRGRAINQNAIVDIPPVIGWLDGDTGELLGGQMFEPLSGMYADAFSYDRSGNLLYAASHTFSGRKVITTVDLQNPDMRILDFDYEAALAQNLNAISEKERRRHIPVVTAIEKVGDRLWTAGATVNILPNWRSGGSTGRVNGLLFAPIRLDGNGLPDGVIDDEVVHIPLQTTKHSMAVIDRLQSVRTPSDGDGLFDLSLVAQVRGVGPLILPLTKSGEYAGGGYGVLTNGLKNGK